MKTSEFKYNLDVIAHLTEHHVNKNKINLTLLDQYSSFGSVEYFSIPVKVEAFIKDPSLLDRYNFKNKDQEYYINFFKRIVDLTSLQRAEKLKNLLAKSWFTAYYTPKEMVDLKIYHLLKSEAEIINSATRLSSYNILEPSCGNGRYINAIRTAINRLNKEGLINHNYAELVTREKLIIEAVEIEPIARHIVRHLYPEVKIHNTPFQDTNLILKKYDLIATNIPFSKTKIILSKREDEIHFKDKGDINLQQYYFYKGASLLKEKGKLAYLTSSVIADSNVYNDLRKYMVYNHDLLVNVRLPNSTFDNTQVVSDYIVFQKNANKKALSVNEELYTTIGIKNIETANNLSRSFNFNNFFLENQNNLIGNFDINRMHGRETITLNFKDSTTALVKNIADLKLFEIQTNKISQEKIKKVSPPKKKKSTESLQLDLFTSISQDTIKAVEKAETVNKTYQHTFLKSNGIREDKLLFFDDTFGHFSSKEDNQNEFIFNKIGEHISKKEARLLLNILLSYESIFNIEHNEKEKLEAQENLIKAYDELIKIHPLSYYKEELLEDTIGSEVLKLETIENGIVNKADILTDKDFLIKAKTEKLYSYEDALMASLNKTNTLDFDFIKDSLDLKISLEEIQKEMVDKGLLFIQFNKENKIEYVLKDVFISGYIYTKIDTLHSGKEQLPEWFGQEKQSNQLNLLNEAKNPWLDFDQISIQLGNSWMDKKYFENFIEKDVFDLDPQTIKLSQFESNSIYTIIPHRNIRNNQYIDQKYAIRRFGRSDSRLVMSPTKLIEACLNNVTPTFTYKEELNGTGKTVTKKDVIAFKLAQHKMKEIETLWKTFLAKLPVEEKKKIEHIYNYKYNNHVQRKINGEHLKFNLSGGIKLRSHQKDAVYKIIEDGGAIIDHKVGAGKTFTMITASRKMKELGIIKKPVIACLKANVKEIYREYKLLYPDAKILFEEPNLSNKETRKDYFSKIANNDWDCIIMKHDTLSRIPIPEDVEKEYLKEQIDKLKHDFDLLNDNENISKRQLKGLQERIENTELRIKYLTQYLKDNSDKMLYNIHTLGIDHLFIDESHHFKNVGFNSVHMNVAGLGTRKGSKKAVNLKMQIMTLHKKYGHDKGITFCTGTVISNSMVELYNVLNMKAPNELHNLGIRSFDSFAKLYAIKSSEYEMGVTSDIKIKERFRNFVNIPELIGLYKKHANIVNDHNFKVDKPNLASKLIEVEPNDLQINFNDKLIEFVEKEDGSLLEGITGKRYAEEQMNAKMLLCTNLSKKASIDMRLVNASFPKMENGKIEVLCENLNKIYKQFSDDKGVQIVFSDIGTPTKEENKFSVYQAIKDTLTEQYNIPGNEIAFIHEHDSSLNKKQAFFKEVNNGNYRIVIGSTAKLGTGVNIQKRCTALHHIDIPWRPSDMEQRNGRAERQGNWLAKEKNNNVVHSFIYATKKSLDAYNFQILAHKDRFINQIKNGSVSQRTFNEGDVGEGGEVSYAVLSACVSGNTELLEKIKLEKQVEKLEDEIQFKKNQSARAESNVKYYTVQNQEINKQINNLNTLLPDIQESFGKYYASGSKNDLPPVYDIDGNKVPLKKVDALVHQKYLTSMLDINSSNKHSQVLFRQGHYSVELIKRNYVNKEPKLEIIIKDNKNKVNYDKRSNVIPKKDIIKVIPDRLCSVENSISNKQKEIKSNKIIIKKNQSIIDSSGISNESKIKIEELKKEINRLDKIVLSQSKTKKRRKKVKL